MASVERKAKFACSKRLSCVHVRTLKMSTDVLCVTYSPNQKLLAVALLDATVKVRISVKHISASSWVEKVFYADTLKFFLSLFGHKLPVLSVAFSADSSLIATGYAWVVVFVVPCVKPRIRSADKNVKVWGAEFGDCHKSFFAHQVSFILFAYVSVCLSSCSLSTSLSFCRSSL